jgi:hypothetical protein
VNPVERLFRAVARTALREASQTLARAQQLLPDKSVGLPVVDPPQPIDTVGFVSEQAMLPQLRSAARELWIDAAPECTWLLLEEQLLHSRIADLVLIRLDVAALRLRLEGDWNRPLSLGELRVLHALRQDRATRAVAVAKHARMTRDNAAQVLRRLASDGFVSRDADGAFRRLAPSRAIAQRVITFEAKRDDPGGALQQARGHRAWADETYVAFDAQYDARFRALVEQYRRVGVGLLELSPTSWQRLIRARPVRRANRLEAGLIGERALGRLLATGSFDRPERRLPHGDQLGTESEPILVGHDADALRELRAGLAAKNGLPHRQMRRL